MFSFHSKVRFSEVDHNLKLTLPAILTYFQDCSVFHSDSIGMGVEYMMEEGHMWILSSWQIIVDRYPKLYEDLTISTWAYGWKGFMGYRNFKMEDAEGNMVAYANTNWIYMDMKSGRPTRIPTSVSDAYSIEPQLPMEVASRKIEVSGQGRTLDPILVRHSDIDSNEHVNNERYVLMAQEFLPEGFVVKQMRAEYKKSAVYGDVLYPMILEEEGKRIVVLNDKEQKPYAIVEFYAKV